jgi:hypothetical protein
MLITVTPMAFVTAANLLVRLDALLLSYIVQAELPATETLTDASLPSPEDTKVVAVNVADLVIPLTLRYVRPSWFTEVTRFLAAVRMSDRDAINIFHLVGGGIGYYLSARMCSPDFPRP